MNSSSNDDAACRANRLFARALTGGRRIIIPDGFGFWNQHLFPEGRSTSLMRAGKLFLFLKHDLASIPYNQHDKIWTEFCIDHITLMEEWNTSNRRYHIPPVFLVQLLLMLLWACLLTSWSYPVAVAKNNKFLFFLFLLSSNTPLLFVEEKKKKRETGWRMACMIVGHIWVSSWLISCKFTGQCLRDHVQLEDLTCSVIVGPCSLPSSTKGLNLQNWHVLLFRTNCVNRVQSNLSARCYAL